MVTFVYFLEIIGALKFCGFVLWKKMIGSEKWQDVRLPVRVVCVSSSVLMKWNNGIEVKRLIN